MFRNWFARKNYDHTVIFMIIFYTDTNQVHTITIIPLQSGSTLFRCANISRYVNTCSMSIMRVVTTIITIITGSTVEEVLIKSIEAIKSNSGHWSGFKDRSKIGPKINKYGINWTSVQYSDESTFSGSSIRIPTVKHKNAQWSKVL